MLTPKQQQFVSAYLLELNATKAAMLAGYSPKTAKQQGSRLLTNVDIATAIEQGRAKARQTDALTAERVLEEWRRISFVDTRTFYDEAGNLKPVKDWTVEQGAAVSEFEVIKKNAAAGDGIIDTVHKIKRFDKVKTLDALGKYFGLNELRVVHSGGLTITHELPE